MEAIRDNGNRQGAKSSRGNSNEHAESVTDEVLMPIEDDAMLADDPSNQILAEQATTKTALATDIWLTEYCEAGSNEADENPELSGNGRGQHNKYKENWPVNSAPCSKQNVGRRSRTDPCSRFYFYPAKRSANRIWKWMDEDPFFDNGYESITRDDCEGRQNEVGAATWLSDIQSA